MNLSMPVFVAPAGVHGLASTGGASGAASGGHGDGEASTARACAGEGVVFGVSQHSTTNIEDIAQAAKKAAAVTAAAAAASANAGASGDGGGAGGASASSISSNPALWYQVRR